MKSNPTKNGANESQSDEFRSNRRPFAPIALSGQFKLEKFCRLCRKNRQGAAVVEFAVVAPIFFLLVFGMIEYGRMVMVQQILTNASREGARLAVLDGISTTDVQTAVDTYLGGAGITGGPPADVVANAPVPPDYANSITVTVQIPFGQVSWLPSPMFLDSGLQLTATTTMRAETVN